MGYIQAVWGLRGSSPGWKSYFSAEVSLCSFVLLYTGKGCIKYILTYRFIAFLYHVAVMMSRDRKDSSSMNGKNNIPEYFKKERGAFP
jgi:hypothetical protein